MLVTKGSALSLQVQLHLMILTVCSACKDIDLRTWKACLVLFNHNSISQGLSAGASSREMLERRVPLPPGLQGPQICTPSIKGQRSLLLPSVLLVAMHDGSQPLVASWGILCQVRDV